MTNAAISRRLSVWRCHEVEGTYGIVVISPKDPDRIIAARKGSPLLIGVGDGENFIASDASAIVEHTRQVVYLDDGEVADITRTGVRTMTIDDVAVEKQVHRSDTRDLADRARRLSITSC